MVKTYTPPASALSSGTLGECHHSGQHASLLSLVLAVLVFGLSQKAEDDLLHQGIMILPFTSSI